MKVKNLRIKLKRNLLISMICPLFSALALICLIFVNSNRGGFHLIMSYIIGVLLWLSPICEIVFLIMASSKRKYIESKMKTKLLQDKCRPGIAVFFSSREALFCDVVFIISAIATIIIIAARISRSYVVFPVLAVLYLSFNAHCFLNGKNYRFLKAYNKFVKERKKG